MNTVIAEKYLSMGGPLIVGLMLLVSLSLFALTISRRWKLLKMGVKEPTVRTDKLIERIKGLFTQVLGQSRLFHESQAGLMHALIFWGFCVVALRTMVLFVMAFAPGFHIPGLVGTFYNMIRDGFELVVIVGVMIAFYRRIMLKPARIELSNEALLILFIIFYLMVSDLTLDGAEILLEGPNSAAGGPAPTRISPVAFGFASALKGMGLKRDVLPWVGVVAFLTHLGAILVFLNLLPLGKHFHVITSIPNIFLRNLEPKGRYQKLDIEGAYEREEDIGINKFESYTWKDMLDLYSCTECGRCAAGCPANLTGKALNPKHLIMNLRNEGYSRVPLHDQGVQKPHGEGEEAEVKTLVPDVISPEVIWSCTTCNYCETHCPLFIEHIGKMVRLRQYKVMMEGDFPSELNQTFRGMENNSNPWGLGSDARADWCQGLDVPIMADKGQAEYLYFVGCAGAYDDRYQKVAKAMVSILNQAGVDYAILGAEEICTGDSARRAGNEYLFQTLAQTCVDTINAYNVKKIITTCPHCYHTIKEEFPQFGGLFEVTHASVFIRDLLAKGTIKLDGRVSQRVVFHDSCYLGRYHDIYDEPREVLERLGAQTQEMEMHHRRAMCCGAGGARMWMEEAPDQRVNNLRVKQALDEKAEMIVSSCPFCLTMLDDGVKAADREDVKTRDLIELVAANMRKDQVPAKADKAPERVTEPSS